ncbi:MAG TPA: flagellar protein FlbB [Xanthobacteraceae bacterium]|nr:flagellar protein FlbB [Xanthobacteraceae bacterium]
MELRLIPVVTFAAASLLAVKAISLAHFDGHLPFETVFSREGTGDLAAAGDDADITGSTPAQKDASAKPAEPVSKEPMNLPNTPAGIAAGMPGGLSPAERALLERLQERRQELDARNRDLELRENLIKDAEKRLENRIDELKDTEDRINGKGGEQAAKLKALVVMYEGMKPKDAARIFDRLDQNVLVDVAAVMNPRKLADVLALMNADAAQRLTVELARRNSAGERGLPASDLPKIEAKPGN